MTSADERGDGRACDPAYGRVTYEWTDVCVRVDGPVSERTCVDT